MKGNGRVILVDYASDRIVHELKCFARPVDAAVSDSGSYIVHDCGFGCALRGDVIAINTSGDEIYRRHYRANIFNIGLSPCGRYAAVQTANADNKDSNILEVLDLKKGKRIFTVRPIGAWADGYLFDTNADGELGHLRVNLRNLGYFRYSATGEFLDAESLQVARLDKGDYTTKIMAAQELLKTDPTDESARKARSVADAALAQGALERYDWGALAHRVRGESFELLGQLSDALEAYEQALAMNPKVGVQRRATTLRKKLSAKE
ncbi:tetratricopeptide repeat protein [Lelliottia sp. SL45]|uniref:tetratricopeptide repeat protein n=1 Tax=Lelliottia sp. SL45 TaxID=2994665 RepID=UPI002275751D|nr:tetratricopeptide repeat protein [Lelliottia sp. SL45]MCY1700886.1 tetratricopeptide repeat protein [Lelliottia sp. SL45]